MKQNNLGITQITSHFLPSFSVLIVQLRDDSGLILR